MRNVFSAACSVIFAVAVLSGARADVRLPKIFTDDMMIQRDQPVRVWGWAEPGEPVKVSLAGKESAVRADEKGCWRVELPALKEGANLELSVAGKNTIVLKNVIVGDLWVCSGQSNMEFALNGALNGAEDVKAADFPGIRRIRFNHATSAYPEEDAPASGPWQVCSPKTAGGFTAVGFYFAREIHQKTGVPIGILDDNWGGTPIEPWTPVEGIGQVANFQKVIADREKAFSAYQAGLPQAMDGMEKWIAQTREAIRKGERILPAPNLPAHPWASGWCTMYNAMIHPLVRFPIKGAIWYQGESNGGEGDSYYDKMCALIGGWRKNWGIGDFPFYFVQLANYQKSGDSPAGGDGWSRLRAAQLKALSIPNTGMAVIIDIGAAGDIHPKNKYDVGVRLSRWALARDYGQKELVVSGPLFREMKIEGDKAILLFDHTGTGLMVGKKSGRSPVEEEKDGKLKWFAVAGADKKWEWADAMIQGNTVVVSSPGVKAPVAVRYAFFHNPEGANLYNREGLPASPFRTDNW
ncbi:MAG: sialate O-acetylesterase [Planctomycetota bacterium]